MSRYGKSSSSDVPSTSASGTVNREQRERRPTARYVELSSWEFIQHNKEEVKPKKERRQRSHGDASDRHLSGKWGQYRNKISSLARAITRDQHALEAYEMDTSKAVIVPKEELKKHRTRVDTNKRAILSQFEQLAGENAEHTRWPQLKVGYDDDDSVDVEDIMCSVCNTPDAEGNDILLCDRAGCLRAYHQNCLDPPALSEEIDPEADWFCRQCACLDECLDLVGEVLGCDCDSYTELFPELRLAESSSSDHGAMAPEYDDDEDDDSDYDPAEKITEHAWAEASDSGRSRAHSTGTLTSGGVSEDEEQEEGAIVGSDEDTGSSDGSDLSDDILSEATSGIDQDELHGLLMDADLAAGEVTERLHTRQLRPRGSRSVSSTDDRSRTAEGAADVGKQIAVVRRGAIVVGDVVSFRYDAAWHENARLLGKVEKSSKAEREQEHPAAASGGEAGGDDEAGAPAAVTGDGGDMQTAAAALTANEAEGDLPVPQSLEEGVWTVIFEDEEGERDIGLAAIREHLVLYADYKDKLEGSSSAVTGTDSELGAADEQGKLDVANVLTYKRVRQRTDYAALNKEMFGDLPEEDSQDSDAAYGPRDGTSEAGVSPQRSVDSVSAQSTGSGPARGLRSTEQVRVQPKARRGRPRSGAGAKTCPTESVPAIAAARKRGRPRKVAPLRSSPRNRSSSLSQQSEDSDSSHPSTPRATPARKRGRPPSSSQKISPRALSDASSASSDENDASSEESSDHSAPVKVKRGRGRPPGNGRKPKLQASAEQFTSAEKPVDREGISPTPRKRGRPRKTASADITAVLRHASPAAKLSDNENEDDSSVGSVASLNSLRASETGKRPRGRPPRSASKESPGVREEQQENATPTLTPAPKKRGRPRKVPAEAHVTMLGEEAAGDGHAVDSTMDAPDGGAEHAERSLHTPSLGHPRSAQPASQSSSPHISNDLMAAADEGDVESPAVAGAAVTASGKKRGRPRKDGGISQPLTALLSPSAGHAAASRSESRTPSPLAGVGVPVAKKPRGRPPGSGKMPAAPTPSTDVLTPAAAAVGPLSASASAPVSTAVTELRGVASWSDNSLAEDTYFRDTVSAPVTAEPVSAAPDADAASDYYF